MKSKSMVLLAVAIGCGLVAAFLTAKLGAGGKQDFVPVLVAAKNLDQGTKLDKIEEQFVRKPFPRESLPPEYIDDVSMLKDKVLQRTLKAGSHVTSGDVTPRSTIELPTDPKTGARYKAMALKVAPETVVGGLVLPGAHVDVVCVDHLQNGRTVSNMILQNALVVSVNEVSARPDDRDYIKNAQTVTLAVKQREGLLLAMAQERGHVFLMLRDPDDKTVIKTIPTMGGGEGSNASTGSDVDDLNGVEKTKILVAKVMIPAGTLITEPEKLFDEKEWSGTVPNNYIIKIDELKGKTVTRAIPPNVPATKDAVEELKPGTNGAFASTGEGENHTMIIQVPGQTPYYAHFHRGRLDEGSLPPGSTPKNGSAMNQEIKPQQNGDKNDSKDEPKRPSDPG
jgi:Flp pilus assembly protein CpaB